MRRYRFFILSLGIVVLDQITKFLVVKYVPMHTVGWSFAGDFFRLIHVRNLGALFSLGSGIPDVFRVIFLVVLPTLVLLGVAISIVRSRNIDDRLRWLLAAIIGGGLGNLIDRIFRPEGVVDFLDFKFYGLFGLERWPTFNVADSTLVVSVIVMIIVLLVEEIRIKKS